MSNRLLVLGIVLNAVAAATPADAATSGIPFTVDCGQDDGFQITQSGTYLLRSAVGNCSSSSSAIHVLASNVILDLQGRAVGNNGAGNGFAGILVDGNDVTIRNGTIGDGWDKGIYASGSRVVVENVVVRGNTYGIELGDDSTISGSTIARSEQRGIQIDGNHATITGNTIVGNAYDGINAGDNVVISKNVIVGNDIEGIRVGFFATISGNVVSGNGHGITTISDSTIAKNVVNGNGTHGMTVGDHVVIKGNKISGNGNSGIVATGNGNQITKNVASGNGSDAINAYVGNVIKGNKVNGNHGRGIAVTAGFSPSTIVSGNTTFGNKGAGVDTGVDVAGAGSNKSNTDCNPSDMCVSKTIKANLAIGCTEPGVTIDTPGTYLLNGQAEVCSSLTNNAIRVTASNVIIDLQGFGLSANGHAVTGILVDPGATSVTIRNGAITGFNIAIEINEVDATVTGLTIAGNADGIEAGVATTISKNTIVSNTASGITGFTNDVVTSNVIGGNSGVGMFVRDSATISGNVVAGNGSDGIDAGDMAKIFKNQIAGNVEGIAAIDAGVFTANTIKGNFDYGIVANDGNEISKNTVAGNGNDGINVQGGAMISKNVATANRHNGIALTGDLTTLRSNTATGNIDNGIKAYTPNTAGDIAGNTVNGNGLLGIDADVNPITVTKVNKAKDNGNPARCNPASACE